MRWNVSLIGVLAVLSICCPPWSPVAQAADVLWKVVDIDGRDYEVHLVTDGTLGGSFPSRSLSWTQDRQVLTDVYVVDSTTGEAVGLTRALQILALLQSYYKPPANPANSLVRGEAISDGDLDYEGRGYDLYTSYYFSDSYVDSFVVSGAEGLDDPADRADLYKIVFFDMILQPDMMDSPAKEHRYQSMVDLMATGDTVVGVLGTGTSILQKGRDLDVLGWQDYKDAVEAIKEDVGHTFNVKYVPPETPNTPLDKLSTALDIVSEATAISGACARELLLQSLANERAQSRIPVIENFLLRAQAAGDLDPAAMTGFLEAKSEINEYIDGYYSNLAVIIGKAVVESGDNILRVAKYSKYVISHYFGHAAAAKIGTVALPYVLSYKTFQGIRNHADRARTASLAATVHRKLFESYGLPYHKARLLTGGQLNGVELQAFLDLYQMTWYLGARHYQDTVWALNNRLTRFWGAGWDLILPGTPYDDMIEDLKESLDRDRVVAQQMVPTSYLATVPLPQSAGVQRLEIDWLASLVREEIISSPTPEPTRRVGVCITLPWDPAGTPAVEGINIRFEPRECWDSTWSQPWECSSNDPDGECTARVRLAWDTDTDPNNANCATGSSGPCPIVGAEALSPERGVFVWEPIADGLDRDDYYVYATIIDGSEEASTYSDGHYEFVDPIFEPDAWRVAEVQVAESGLVGDDDGIPELGETVEVNLILDNESGRPLERIKVHRVTLAGDPLRYFVTDDWNPSNPDDLAVSYIIDDVALAPDANVGQAVVTDDLELYISSDMSSTTIPVVAWVGYWDPSNPNDPEYRRIQEIGFVVQVSDGSEAPHFVCDHTTLVGDTDGDGVFESGENGHFTATLCNNGSWEGTEVRGTFEDPPPEGSWRDEDAPFPDISVGDCETSTDDFNLDLDLDECGTYNLPMTVTYGEGQSQDDVVCQITATCAPWQSIRDDADVGVVPVGETIRTSIPISNSGAATLVLSSVVEKTGAEDTEIVSFPPSIPPGQGDEIVVDIDTASIAPGRYDRTIVVTSNANNLDERESIIYFGVTAGGAAQQLTTNGIGSEPDIYGNTAVFDRGGNIWSVDVTTKVETQLTAVAEEDMSPRIWGRRVAFARRDPATTTTNVFLYDLDTGTTTQLTNLPVYQVHPDIYDDVVIWEDQRNGRPNADVYQYRIGVSSMNGEALVNLPSRYAINEPRIEEKYVVYEIEHFFDPADDSTYRGDLGFFRRSNGQTYSLGLEDNSPCDPGSGYDVFDRHFAFGCDCGDACDRDDQLYYVNMDTNSAPTRLTCVLDLNDREEPIVFADRILYTLDGEDDIYEVAIGTGCQTEVPLHVGAAAMYDLGGDPRTEAYVFRSNESGTTQLWGVVPEPPVEVSVRSFDLDQSTADQGDSLGYQVEVHNRGTESVGTLSIALKDDEEQFATLSTSGTMSSGEVQILTGSWAVGATAALGAHALSACLSPAPDGDADSSNDCSETSVVVSDDDTVGPVISSISVDPGPGDDGDPFVEGGEGATMRWTAIDAKGISWTRTQCGASSFEGVSDGGGAYHASIGTQAAGNWSCTVSAADGDDSSAENSAPPYAYTVYPPAPAIVSVTPSHGASGVDPRVVVEIEFSVDMTQATLNPTTIVLETMVGDPISASISYDAEQQAAMLEPGAALASFTAYRVTVKGGTNGVRDTLSNPMAEDETWTFTTGEIDAPEPPLFEDGFESGNTSSWSATVPGT